MTKVELAALAAILLFSNLFGGYRYLILKDRLDVAVKAACSDAAPNAVFQTVKSQPVKGGESVEKLILVCSQTPHG